VTKSISNKIMAWSAKVGDGGGTLHPLWGGLPLLNSRGARVSRAAASVTNVTNPL